MKTTERNITRRIIDEVAGLDRLKTRRQSGLFKAEGTKCVLDTIPHFMLKAMYATPDWLAGHPDWADRAIETSRGELSKMSSLSTPADVIAVMEIPEYKMREDLAENNIVLALDTIQDPGNLGTIIRVADWFGIEDIICSRETADCFSPKVIQSTMGSISRVRVHYCELPATIKTLSRDGRIPVYGTFLDGRNIDACRLSQAGIIVIGNEGNGISHEVEAVVSERLTIPSYPTGRATAESLNAAVATAITVSKFRASR